MEHRVVDGRGGLADTAAHLVHRGAAGVHRRGQVALGRSAAAGGVVIGEHLAGHEHHAVTGLGRQFYVVLAVGGAADIGGAAAQQIPEQLGLQALLGLLGLGQGEGDGDRLTLGGRLVGRLGLLHVKVHTHHGVGGLVGLRVHGGVHGLGVQFLVHGIKIRLPGTLLVGGEGHRLGLSRLAPQLLADLVGQRLLHLLLRLLPVNGYAGNALGNLQGVTLHHIGGLGDAAAGQLVGLIQQSVQLLLAALAPIQGQLHVLAHSHQAAQIGAALDDKVAPSRLPGLLGTVLCVQIQGTALDAAAPGTVFHRQSDILGLLHALLQSRLGLLLGHAAHGHTAYGNTLQNGLRAAHPGTQAHIGPCQYNHCRSDSQQQSFLLWVHGTAGPILLDPTTFHITLPPRTGVAPARFSVYFSTQHPVVWIFLPNPACFWRSCPIIAPLFSPYNYRTVTTLLANFPLCSKIFGAPFTFLRPWGIMFSMQVLFPARMPASILCGFNQF